LATAIDIANISLYCSLHDSILTSDYAVYLLMLHVKHDLLLKISQKS